MKITYDVHFKCGDCNQSHPLGIQGSIEMGVAPDVWELIEIAEIPEEAIEVIGKPLRCDTSGNVVHIDNANSMIMYRIA